MPISDFFPDSSEEETQPELDPKTNLQAPGTSSTSLSELIKQPKVPKTGSYYGANRFNVPTESMYSDLQSYADYGVSLSPISDLDEARAQRQSTAEKWGNGLLKAGVTTVGAIAENTLGIVAGLGELASGGQYYDNAVGQTVDSANEWMREAFPNYYTKAEMNPDRSLWDSMGTANFWADKVANGLGYTLGSIATMYLTGGVGPIMGIANFLSKGGQLLSTASRLGRLSRAGKMGLLAMKSGKTLDQASRAAKLVRAGQVMESGAMMSLAEASVEARETRKMALENLIAKEIETNPDVNTKADISGERLTEFENLAIGAGNTAFGLNMAVLSSTNIGMFGHLMRPGYQVAKKLPLSYSRESGTAALNTFASTLPGWMQKTATAAKTISPLVKNSAIEGLQEGSQFASNKASILMAESKAFDGGTVDLIEALNEGFAETFGTAEGIEQTAIGVIVGALGGAGGVVRGVQERKQQDQRVQEVIDLMSNSPLDDAVNIIEDSDKRSEIVNKLDVALEEGNIKEYHNLRDALLTNLVNFHVERGSFQAFREQLESVGTLPEEEFKKLIGIPQDMTLKDAEITSQQQYVQDIIKKAEVAKKRKEQIESIFPDPNQGPKSLAKTLESKEAKQARKFQSMALATLKNKLYSTAVQADLSKDRRKSLADAIEVETTNLVDDNSSEVKLTKGIDRKSLDDFVVEIFGEEGTLNTASEEYNKALEEFQNTQNLTNFRNLIKAKDKLESLIDNETKKFIEERSGITAETAPLDYQSILNKVTDYTGLSFSEMEANKTLNTLFNDPQQREIFKEQLMNAKEAKAEQRRKAKEKEDLEKAKTTDDVDDTDTSTEEGKNSKDKKRREKNEKIKEAKQRFQDMSPEELEGINVEELSDEEKEAYNQLEKDKERRAGAFEKIVLEIQDLFKEYNKLKDTSASDAVHKAAADIFFRIHKLQQNFYKSYPNEEFDEAYVADVGRIERSLNDDGYSMGGETEVENLTYDAIKTSDEYKVGTIKESNNESFKTPDGSPKLTYIAARPLMYKPSQDAEASVVVPGTVNGVQYTDEPIKPNKKTKKEPPGKKNSKGGSSQKADTFKRGDIVDVTKGNKVKRATVLSDVDSKQKFVPVEFEDGRVAKVPLADIKKVQDSSTASSDPNNTDDQNNSPLRVHIGKEVTITRGSYKGQSAEVVNVSKKDPYKKLTVELEDGTRKDYAPSSLDGLDTVKDEDPISTVLTQEEAIKQLLEIANINSERVKLDEERNVYVLDGKIDLARTTSVVNPGEDNALKILAELNQQEKIQLKDGKFSLDLRSLSKAQLAVLSEIGSEISAPGIYSDLIAGKDRILLIHSAAKVGTQMDNIMRDFFAGKDMNYENYKIC